MIALRASTISLRRTSTLASGFGIRMRHLPCPHRHLRRAGDTRWTLGAGEVGRKRIHAPRLGPPRTSAEFAPPALPGPRRRRGEGGSALADLVARLLLVDDVEAPLAPHDEAVALARLRRLDRMSDLHCAAQGIPFPRPPPPWRTRTIRSA